MSNSVPIGRRHYSVKGQEEHFAVLERIVVDYADITFPPDVTVTRNLCGAVEVSVSKTGELAVHFVLSEGYFNTFITRPVKYLIPPGFVNDLTEPQGLLDANHILWETTLEVGLISFFTNKYVEKEMLLTCLAARWLAGYIANNYRISVELILEGVGNLAKSTAAVAFAPPCNPGLGVGIFCSPTKEVYSPAQNEYFRADT